jgi:hypothetical protein
MMFPLHRATFARQVIPLQAQANCLHNSQFAWIRTFPMKFFFHHATFAWQDTFLQEAADFLLDPQFPRVLSFLF